MNLRSISVFLGLALFGASQIHSAPGLTVSGSELQYNGKKIFFNGLNLAWIDYNSDVGATPLDENAWRKAVQDIRAAGGNSIRWWLFNNMSQSPKIDATTHLVTGPEVNTVANMKKALDIAEEYGVMVSMCLFSHNLMDATQWGVYSGKLDIVANHKLFDDDGSTAFIDKVLIPVVKAIGNHNALMSWELFNEPEGLLSWFTEKETQARLLKFSNKMAAAIHTNAPGTLVSNGIHTFDKVASWSDANLIAAGNQNNGTLDFYQAHFYPEFQETSSSPFDHPYSFWNVPGGKPLIIGEFSAAGWNKETYPAYKVPTKTTTQAYQYAYDNGYAGALAWDYRGFQDKVAGANVVHDFAAAKPGMELLYSLHPEQIKIKDYTPVNATGDGVMQITYSSIASEASVEYVKPMSLAGKTTASIKVRTEGASPAMSLNLIVKSHNGDSWYWSEGSTCDVPAGNTWVTCSINLATPGSGDPVYLATIHSFLIRTRTAGYTGKIQFNDLLADTQVITNFDTQFDVFGVAAAMDGGDAITNITTVYLGTSSLKSAPRTQGLNVQFKQGELLLRTPQIGNMRLVIYNASGIVVRELHQGELSAGLHAFPLLGLPAGRYAARVITPSIHYSGAFTLN